MPDCTLANHQARKAHRNFTKDSQYLPLVVVLDGQQSVAGWTRPAVANPKVQLPRNNNLLNLFHDRLAVFDRAAQLAVSQSVKVRLDHERLAIFIPNRVNGFQCNAPMHVRLQSNDL